MAGKYSKKKRGGKKRAAVLVVLVLLLAAAIIAAVFILPALRESGEESEPRPTEGTPEATAGQTEEASEAPTLNVEEIPVETRNIYDLGNGLELNRIDSYAGIYMEDGSDEIVSDVLMVSVSNRTEQDLQLARIRLIYADGEALFEVTNLPAGATAVVLEKNRMAGRAEMPEKTVAENVIYFEERMDPMAERFAVSGGSGMLQIENISGEDITGEIQVYYKNGSAEQYYGGITYLARVTGGLKAGERASVMASHFAPDMCTVVKIEVIN